MDKSYVGKKVTVQKIDEPDKIYFGKVILYRYLGINHFIPKEYQEVEWIGSNGTQWFDTGVIIEKQTQIEIWVTQATDTSVFGVKDSSTLTYWGITGRGSYSSFDYQDLYKSISGIQGVNTQIPYTDFVKYTVLGKSIKVNDVLYFQSSSTEWHTTEYTLPLFCKCNKKVYNDYLTGQIKRCIITNTNNNTILRDFIPCYNKSSNVIGMYDRVNGIFYTNRGTGTFTKGNDVNNDTDNFISYISCPALGHNLIITDENESEYNIELLNNSRIRAKVYLVRNGVSASVITPNHGRLGTTSNYYYNASGNRVSTYDPATYTGEQGHICNPPIYVPDGFKYIQIIVPQSQYNWQYALRGFNEKVTYSDYIQQSFISDTTPLSTSSFKWVNILFRKGDNSSVDPGLLPSLEKDVQVYLLKTPEDGIAVNNTQSNSLLMSSFGNSSSDEEEIQE